MFGLYRLFQFSAFISNSFKNKLSERNVVLVMMTREGNVARTFRFTNGKVRSQRKTATDKTCTLVWKTPVIGARAMVDIAAGKPRAIEQAVLNGDLMLEGDAMAIKWFLDTIRKLRKIYFGVPAKKAHAK